MARARKQSASQEEFKCPECGRTFTRAAALGAHRRQAHGVVGTSSRSRSTGARSRRTGSAANGGARRSAATAASTPRRSRSSTTASNNRPRRAGADRDALLKALFPNGIPPKEEIIRAANSWLEDAERLARMR
jgi:uncharacterized C2H2 Zn-finger protein